MPNVPRHPRLPVLVALVSWSLTVGCDRRSAQERSEPVEATHQTGLPLPSTTPAVDPPQPVAVAPIAAPTAPSAPSTTGCQTLDISPHRLSAAWPTLLGKRVRLSARIERSLGITDALVVAGGERFVIMLSPSDSWEGTRSRVFTVMGSATVNAGTGPITLPQLILAGDDCDEGEP